MTTVSFLAGAPAPQQKPARRAASFPAEAVPAAQAKDIQRPVSFPAGAPPAAQGKGTQRPMPSRSDTTFPLDPSIPGTPSRAAAQRAGDDKRFMVAQLDETPGVPCPCGVARRAFITPDNPVASLHMTDITADARVHYHKRMTEIYFILEGQGFLELDGERVPVRPNTSVLIKPGCRHRAVGQMRILNIPIPAFDESDEFFD